MKRYWLGAIALAAAFCPGCASDRKEQQPVAETPYRQPLVSPGAQFGSLPPAVQNAVRAETGSADIEDVIKTKVGDRAVYEVRFADPQLFPPMHVAQDGSVLNRDMTVAVGAPRDRSEILFGAGAGGLKFEDLPVPVANVVGPYAPPGEVASIDRQLWGNQLVYIISFKDEVRYPKLYVASDGRVLKEGHK